MFKIMKVMRLVTVILMRDTLRNRLTRLLLRTAVGLELAGCCDHRCSSSSHQIIEGAYMKGYILKWTPKPSRKPARYTRLCKIAHNKATTRTPSRPSELPRVLMIATIGFSSQMLANLRDCSMDIFFEFRRTRTISHPATISPVANSTFPNGNHVFDQEVGRSIQARRGVYRYVSRSYGERP